MEENEKQPEEFVEPADTQKQDETSSVSLEQKLKAARKNGEMDFETEVEAKPDLHDLDDDEREMFKNMGLFSEGKSVKHGEADDFELEIIEKYNLELPDQERMTSPLYRFRLKSAIYFGRLLDKLAIEERIKNIKEDFKNKWERAPKKLILSIVSTLLILSLLLSGMVYIHLKIAAKKKILAEFIMTKDSLLSEINETSNLIVCNFRIMTEITEMRKGKSFYPELEPSIHPEIESANKRIRELFNYCEDNGDDADDIEKITDRMRIAIDECRSIRHRTMQVSLSLTETKQLIDILEERTRTENIISANISELEKAKVYIDDFYWETKNRIERLNKYPIHRGYPSKMKLAQDLIANLESSAQTITQNLSKIRKLYIADELKETLEASNAALAKAKETTPGGIQKKLKAIDNSIDQCRELDKRYQARREVFNLFEATDCKLSEIDYFSNEIRIILVQIDKIPEEYRSDFYFAQENNLAKYIEAIKGYRKIIAQAHTLLVLDKPLEAWGEARKIYIGDIVQAHTLSKMKHEQARSYLKVCQALLKRRIKRGKLAKIIAIKNKYILQLSQLYEQMETARKDLNKYRGESYPKLSIQLNERFKDRAQHYATEIDKLVEDGQIEPAFELMKTEMPSNKELRSEVRSVENKLMQLNKHIEICADIHKHIEYIDNVKIELMNTKSRLVPFRKKLNQVKGLLAQNKDRKSTEMFPENIVNKTTGRITWLGGIDGLLSKIESLYKIRDAKSIKDLMIKLNEDMAEYRKLLDALRNDLDTLHKIDMHNKNINARTEEKINAGKLDTELRNRITKIEMSLPKLKDSVRSLKRYNSPLYFDKHEYSDHLIIETEADLNNIKRIAKEANRLGLRKQFGKVIELLLPFSETKNPGIGKTKLIETIIKFNLDAIEKNKRIDTDIEYRKQVYKEKQNIKELLALRKKWKKPPGRWYHDTIVPLMELDKKLSKLKLDKSSYMISTRIHSIIVEMDNYPQVIAEIEEKIWRLRTNKVDIESEAKNTIENAMTLRIKRRNEELLKYLSDKEIKIDYQNIKNICINLNKSTTIPHIKILKELLKTLTRQSERFAEIKVDILSALISMEDKTGK